jgi:predicted transcriptional regulator
MTMPKIKSASSILKKMIGSNVLLAKKVMAQRVNNQDARLIVQVRTEAGLTQKQLADLIHTSQPAIARLEDAEYDGQSLSMLQKIATALGRTVHVEMPSVI